MSAPSKMVRFAERYTEISVAIIPTAPGKKHPCHVGWNRPENAITTPAAARDFYSKNPKHGIAAHLGASGLVGMDVDDTVNAPPLMKHFGIDLDELKATAPCVIGRNYTLLFRAPGQPLKHRTLALPTKDNPAKSSVVLELRSGGVSCTLPPTEYPGMGRPYQWGNPPRDGKFPPLPRRVLELWLDWPAFNRQALALCPWAPPPKEIPKPKARSTEQTGESVIDAFNSAHDVTAILESHGYQRRGKRFTAPDSSHAAGIVLLDNGRVFCHNQGDALASEHAHDAFDLYRLLEHGGDYQSAVKQAAALLGLKRERAA